MSSTALWCRQLTTEATTTIKTTATQATTTIYRHNSTTPLHNNNLTKIIY